MTSFEQSVQTVKHTAQTIQWVLSPDITDLPCAQENLRPLMGGKGASLWELAQWKLPVPPFCCITTEAFDATLQYNRLDQIMDWLISPAKNERMVPSEFAAAIMACELPTALLKRLEQFVLQHPNRHFAVRSSSALEDGQENSFAGLFQTCLNVQSMDEIACAIKTCWAAIFDERIQQYMQKHRITDTLRMGLILQCLVPAEKSGVIFTVDPVQGRDTEMLIEACFGLGEALVSGQVSPDCYRYDWHARQHTYRHIAEKEHWCVRLPAPLFTKIERLPAKFTRTPVLQPPEIEALASLAVTIQAHTGRPVDIEWAQADGHLYVLQSRPITHLGCAGIDGEWTTADFRDGGVSATVCTPLMASLYKSVMEPSMAAYLRRLGLSSTKDKDVWLQTFYSRPYWNLSAAKHYLSQIPGYNERAFDQGLGITPNYIGDGHVTNTTPATALKGLRALWMIERGCKQKLKQCPVFAKKQKQRLQALKATDFAAMTDAAMFEFATRFLTREYFENETTYFNFIYDNANINALFRERVQKLGFPPSDFPVLLGGLSDISHLAPIIAQWEIRERILQSPDTNRFWQTNTAQQIEQRFLAGETQYEMQSLKQYLDCHGHHAAHELDLRVPRHAESPSLVISQIQEVLQQPESNNPRQRHHRQEQQALDARNRLLAAIPRWKRRRIRRQLAAVRTCLWWREELRDLSTRFYFFVRHILLHVATRLVAHQQLTRVDDIFFLTLEELIALMQGKLPASTTAQRVTDNRRYYEGFRAFVIPDEIGMHHSSTPSTDTKDDGCTWGIAGSPGIVTGRARVIANIDQADRLQPGDILVTRCTDPGWTSKFSLLSGVITETGGILSHAAVICREYGIPAILAVKHAISLIEDGETITMNGCTGEILVGIGQHPMPLGARWSSIHANGGGEGP